MGEIRRLAHQRNGWLILRETRTTMGIQILSSLSPNLARKVKIRRKDASSLRIAQKVEEGYGVPPL